MARQAHILLVEDETSSERHVGEGLRAFGFEPVSIRPASCDDLAGALTRRPDVVLLNLASRAARGNAAGWLAAAGVLNGLAQAMHIPALILGDPQDLLGQDIDGIWDDILSLPAADAFIASRINTLLRLNTMHTELNRRLATCARYGLDAPTLLTRPPEAANPAILVYSDGTEFGVIDAALGRNSEITGSFTAAGALEYLATRKFDMVVMDAAMGPEQVLDFVSGLRRNPRHYNLPLLLAGVPAGADWLNEAFQAGVTEILPAPTQTGLLQNRVSVLVKECRFRETLRSTYRQARHMATSDALTGLYNRGFLMQHVKDMLQPADGFFRPFSLAGLRIRDMDGLNAAHGYVASDRIIRQAAETIAMLMRGEDLVARYDGSKFVVVMPDTPSTVADIAIRRVDAVVAFTDFHVGDAAGPVRIALEGGLAQARAEDTPEMLVARAFGPKIAGHL